MQKISNMVDMLLASANGIQTFQPAPAVQEPNQGGKDFLQILGGLIGSEAGTEEGALISLSDSELNHVKGLLSQSDSANNSLISFKIPLSNSEQAPASMSLLAGSSKHPVTFSSFINIENSLESMLLKSAENLVLQPGEYDELNIGKLIDSPFGYNRGSNLSDQGGHSEFSEMLNTADLEKLAEGESLSIKLANNENLKNNLQTINEITFTKKADLEARDGLNGSRFEVTFKSANDTSQLQAVLVNIKSNPQVAELEGLIAEHQAKDARLILLVPGQAANYSNSDPLMAENSNARLRQFNLQRGAGHQNEISDLDQNFGQTETKTAVMSKQETNFGQTAGENKQDLGATLLHKADLTSINSLNSESFADKMSSSLNLDIQNHGNKVEVITIDDKTRLQMLTRDVQFKIDQPLHKADLPEGGSFRISLTPESLGKIDVQLDVIQDRMIARMIVDSPLAKQVVEANLESLKETLHL